MIAAIDNTFLTVLLNPKAAPRPNPATNQPASHCKQRIEALIDDLSSRGSTLIVPAPALAEALCASSATEAYVETLQSFAAIEIAAFDGRAAIELGRVVRAAILSGDKKSGQTGSWQHVKMDRAIVAIAVSRSATVFYSDDTEQKEFARLAGLNVLSTWELPLPDKQAQYTMSEHSETTWPTQKKPPKSNALEQRPPT